MVTILTSDWSIAYLSLCGLISDEGMFQQLISVGSLMVILDQNCLNKVLELAAPPLGL